MFRTAMVAAAVLVGPGAASAQVERYELGRRMKAFEAAWETADAAGRARAAAVLKDVYPQFFSFRFGEAGRTLDRATHALGSADAPALAPQWLSSLIAVPEHRLVDAGTKELAVTVKPFYPVMSDVPNDLAVRLTMEPGGATDRANALKFPHAARLTLDPLPATASRDAKLTLTRTLPGRTPVAAAAIVSRVANRDERLAKLKAAAEAWPALDTIERATVRDRAALLAELAEGTVYETDVPAVVLLDEAERMIDGKPFFTAALVGDRALSVPLGGKKTAAVRVFVPEKLDAAKPVPVVVGLHGAGGSENLFFEGYGAGKFVDECAKRGWVFVATRGGLGFGAAPPVLQILEQLAMRYPIDRNRVFLVGHSMGAGHAVQLVQKHRGAFAGVALLAGGGAVTDAKAFAELPAFIATGDADFARSGVLALNRTLTASGAKAVTFKDYPNREHLLVVRESLPDVYAMFDDAAKR